MEACKKLVWLASYPKSGNTWFRVFLSNYLRDSDEPANINDLESTPIASARGLFDELSGLSSSDLTHDEIDLYRPDIFRNIAKNSTDLSFHKIHDAFSFNKNREAIIPEDCTKAVLYFVRNPLDVSISFAHHSATSIDKSIHNMNESDFAFCDNKNKLANQLRQKLLSWSEHVESWMNSGLPVLILRYEDMLQDTENQFKKAIEFCGLELNHERVLKSIRNSSMEVLQKQERESGFKEKSQKAKSFFRKGIANDWKNTLSPEQVDEILSQHKELMLKFGYFINPK